MSVLQCCKAAGAIPPLPTSFSLDGPILLLEVLRPGRFGVWRLTPGLGQDVAVHLELEWRGWDGVWLPAGCRPWQDQWGLSRCGEDEPTTLSGSI